MDPHADQQNKLQHGLSIVILHWNRPWSLEIAVESLNRMRGRCVFPIEIILADDGSDAALHPFFDKLPLDQIYLHPQHIYEKDRASVYHTLQAAYENSRFDHLMYVEDDFWFIPQGFRDHGKSHLEGLLASPAIKDDSNPIQGGVDLLLSTPEARFVELARGYLNPRYPSDPITEQIHSGIHFRSKLHPADSTWYSCAWPHIQRTSEALRILLPQGKTLWQGERELSRARQQAYGQGNWVFDAGKCYFVHMNIFTWREVLKQEDQADINGSLRWMELEDGQQLPYDFKAIPGFNLRLLDAFLKGKLQNDLGAYYTSTPFEYAYQWLYRKVLDDL